MVSVMKGLNEILKRCSFCQSNLSKEEGASIAFEYLNFLRKKIIQKCQRKITNRMKSQIVTF